MAVLLGKGIGKMIKFWRWLKSLFIKEYQVDCDWNECGKYFASSIIKDISLAKKFSELLTELNF